MQHRRTKASVPLHSKKKCSKKTLRRMYYQLYLMWKHKRPRPKVLGLQWYLGEIHHQSALEKCSFLWLNNGPDLWKVLILAPTRELAVQISDMVKAVITWVKAGWFFRAYWPDQNFGTTKVTGFSTNGSNHPGGNCFPFLPGSVIACLMVCVGPGGWLVVSIFRSVIYNSRLKID